MRKAIWLLMFIPRGIRRYLQFPAGGAMLGLTLLFSFLGAMFYPVSAVSALIAGLIAMAWVGNDMHFHRMDKN